MDTIETWFRSKSLFNNKAEDMTEEKESNRGLIGPIESGKTFHMPEPPEEGEKVYSDFYHLNCDHIDIQPKSIVLPKFIFNHGMGYKEKGCLLLGFDSDHQNNLYGKVLKAATDGFGKFEIAFLHPEDKSIVSVWKFTEARVQAVDFGFVATQRPTPAELAVEIDYKHLVIGDVSI